MINRVGLHFAAAAQLDDGVAERLCVNALHEAAARCGDDKGRRSLSFRTQITTLSNNHLAEFFVGIAASEHIGHVVHRRFPIVESSGGDEHIGR